ncbi:unnamed protein product [Rotaria sordida]|uniref:Uncharacterized protein n=1 Tax=Rotaria sordida TaxID=392033 RepID=A0A815J3Y0_9BILA|nr:unnamed protein product [Rotaria sordida]CAF1614311.1 unnamed protein product [Rotaria sordida]
MQEFDINSECKCIACPKRIRKHLSVDITLRKINNQFPNYIESFTNDSIVSCGANLGPDEPHNYSDDYIIDDHCPVIDVTTNTTNIEKRYICQAPRTVYMQHLKYVSPFLIISVENDEPLMVELSDPLYIGSHEYHLSGGFNNMESHFTAIIKTNDGTCVRFNDIHSKGCFPHDGLSLIANEQMTKWENRRIGK